MDVSTVTLSIIALIVISIVIYAIILSRRKHISFLRALFLYRVSDLEFHYNHHQHGFSQDDDIDMCSNMCSNNQHNRINSPVFSYLPENIHHKH